MLSDWAHEISRFSSCVGLLSLRLNVNFRSTEMDVKIQDISVFGLTHRASPVSSKVSLCRWG